MDRKYKIAVAGASELGHCAINIEALALEIGRQIARQDCILISGATTGAPHLAAKGAKEAGGTSIGFSPAASETEHKKVYRLPTDYYDVLVYTGFDYSGRNLLMTRAADAVIIVCGRTGTLNEFTIAFEDRKPIGVLKGSGGTADKIEDILRGPHRKGERIIFERDPKKLVQGLVQLLSERKKREKSKQ